MIKIHFHPGVDIGTALSQVTSRRPGDSGADAAGHSAAGHRAVQRVERADPANRPEQRNHVGRRSLRLRPVRPAHAAFDRAGADHAHALRRTRTASDGRSRSAVAASQGDLAQGSGRRDQRLQPGLSDRRGADRHARIPGHAEQHAAHARQLQRHSDQGRRRRDDLHARRGPGSRRQHVANDDRAPQRQPRRPGDAAQERQRLDARHRQPGEADHAADSGRRPRQTCGSICCSTNRCSSPRRSKGWSPKASSPGCSRPP